MSKISFTSALVRSEGNGAGILLTLPKEASAQLPSRGMVPVEVTINEAPFRAVLEPDGKESHWFKVSDAVLDAAHAAAGDTVAVSLELTGEWPEPKAPADLTKALATDEEAQIVWSSITSSARWDWIRWIGSAKQPETRKRRVESIGSRLRAGKRRPCCFDRSQCTLTDA